MASIAGYLTDFADQAVLLPLATIVTVVFAAAGWWRGAVAWAIAIGATLGLVLLLKLVFLACGHLLPFDTVHSPSGHTAASGVTYGGLLAIMARLVTGRERWTLPCAISVAVVIALSRLALGVHTVAEVGIGGLVGVCGAILVTKLAGPPPPTLRLRTMAAAAVLVLVLFHGFRMPAEAAIRHLALSVWPLSACRR